MRIRAALRPLRARTTYLRLVFLTLGSALALAFIMIDMVVLGGVAWRGLWFPLAALVPLAVVVLPPVLVSLIGAVRVVEGSAVRSLVLPGLPENLPPARDWDTRWRASLWFLLHLVTGAVAGLAVLEGTAVVIGLLSAPITGTRLLAPWDDSVGPGWSAAWLPLLVVPALLAYLYLVAALGALLARCATPLLGPSAPERLAELSEAAGRLAERNRLARELHDSVGHALTVTTLQAGAAGRILDSDPEFARQALTAIEEAGRAALADLDHVLGLLRDSRAPARPQPTLPDLPDLLDQARATGVPVELEMTGPVADIPAVVSREGYRIVQECLTNALRHAGRVPVTLRLTVHRAHLELLMDNELTGRPARRTGGRGLTGMRERVELLRGTMTAAPDGGRWRVCVRLPLSTARSVTS